MFVFKKRHKIRIKSNHQVSTNTWYYKCTHLKQQCNTFSCMGKMLFMSALFLKTV